VSEARNWRDTCLSIGKSIATICAVIYVIAWFRVPHLMPRRSFNELAAYIFGGLILSITAIVLLLLGTGEKRWLFVSISVIELILFFGFAAMAAKLYG
jgi:hypothetical protein